MMEPTRARLAAGNRQAACGKCLHVERFPPNTRHSINGPVFAGPVIQSCRGRVSPRMLLAGKPRRAGATSCVAGVEGFEPPNGGIKTRCLTTWRHPSVETLLETTAGRVSHNLAIAQAKSAGEPAPLLLLCRSRTRTIPFPSVGPAHARPASPSRPPPADTGGERPARSHCARRPRERPEFCGPGYHGSIAGR